jgi:hypothetical protein
LIQQDEWEVSRAAGDGSSPAGSASGRGQILVLLVVWILSGVYAAGFLNRGWIPHDEGTLAQSAERVLAGEMPHRDYQEGYTGGLTYLHALAFRLLGVRLLSLRWVLFLAFLLFVPAVYAIAVRMVSPVIAGLMTLLVVAWSVPNYFASLPSWYNLFLATFGILAVLRHVDTRKSSWLFAAGLCAGLSVLFKIVGLYDVAAVFFLLVYREQVLASAKPGGRRERTNWVLYSKIALGVSFLAVLLVLLAERLNPMNLVHYLLPGLAIVGFLIWSESRYGAGGWAERCRGLLRLLLPFALGVALPLALFAVPYALAGALPDLFRDVFLLPFRQIETAHVDLPPPGALLPALPYALVLAFFPAVGRRREAVLAAGAAVALGVSLCFVRVPEVYRAIWYSARSLAVVATVVGCGFLAASRGLTDRKRQEIFLLVCVTALMSLVQFPFSAPIYFCYVAPLAALTILAIVSADPRTPRRIHLAVVGFYLLFAVLFTNREYVFNLGVRFKRYESETPLRLPRAGLRVPEDDARFYEALVSTIQERSGGHGIYAGPDCPEVYFLSAQKNPTRSFFDFLGELYGRPDSLLRLLQDKDVRVVVLNNLPGFSLKPSRAFRTALCQRYPNLVEIGKFTLMWRD